MNKLLAFPNSSLREYLFNDQSIFFLDEYGFWFFDEKIKNRKLFEIDNIKIEGCKETKIPEIRKDLDHQSPLWTRWIGSSFNHEIFRAKSTLRILKIKSFLLQNNISVSLIFTAMPHHYDTSILSIACSFSKVKQIYFERVVFDNYLLPVLQHKDIFSRNNLKCQLNHREYLEIIKEFIEVSKKGEIPKTNVRFNKLYLNFYFTILWIFLWKLKKIFVRYDKLKPWTFVDEYSLTELYKIANNQRSFLKNYTIRARNTSENLKKTKNQNLNLVIYSHFQPEATTFPGGGDWYNHIDLIAEIRLKGFKGKILYKEHRSSKSYIHPIVGPTKVGINRSIDYVKDLESLGCLFLPMNFNCEKSLGNFLPITIAGSVAIERSLRGLKTIVAGEPWFKEMPGIIKLSEINSFEDFSSDFLVYNEEIETSSFNFLNQILTNNTILNYSENKRSGNYETNEESDKNKYIEQIENLIYNLEEITRNNNDSDKKIY